MSTTPSITTTSPTPYNDTIAKIGSELRALTARMAADTTIPNDMVLIVCQHTAALGAVAIFDTHGFRA